MRVNHRKKGPFGITNSEYTLGQGRKWYMGGLSRQEIKKKFNLCESAEDIVSLCRKEFPGNRELMQFLDKEVAYTDVPAFIAEMLNSLCSETDDKLLFSEEQAKKLEKYLQQAGNVNQDMLNGAVIYNENYEDRAEPCNEGMLIYSYDVFLETIIDMILE